MLQSQSTVIEVVSDVVCPWCFIGKRRLEKALSLMGRQDAQVRWKAFELNPDMPKAGMDRRAYRARKFGNLARAGQLEAQVAAAGREEGIDFHFDRIQTIPNTFDAHRLIWAAGQHGVQDQVVDGLFEAYFIDAEEIGNSEVLKRIAIASGLDSGLVDEILTKNIGADEVRSEVRHARMQGVNGVPTFFVDGQPVASGAQRPEILAGVLGPLLGTDSAQCSLDEGACG